MHLNRVTSEDIKAIIRSCEKEYPDPFVPTYALGNHDRRRYFSRIDEDTGLARLLAVFLYTVRGVPINYYGDELGVPDGYFAHRGAKDSLAHPYWWLPKKVAQMLNLYINRDGCRTPMQWEESANAGFSSKQPWLPIHKSYPSCNVESQRADDFSILNIHRNLLHLRKQKVCLRAGSIELLPENTLPAGVVGYVRRLAEEAVYVLLNFSQNARVVEVDKIGEVLVRSGNTCTVNGNRLSLGPYSGIVISG